MKIDKKLLNAWNRDAWIEKKKKLSDCIWFEGALLEHPNNQHVYFAPEPTEYGIVYEIDLTDIVEIVETGRTKEKLDRSYTLARVYLKKNAVVIRQQWMVATEIPRDIRQLSLHAPALAQQTTSESYVDLTLAAQGYSPSGGGDKPYPGDGGGSGGNDSPKPKDPPEPVRPPGGGGAVTGIRG